MEISGVTKLQELELYQPKYHETPTEASMRALLLINMKSYAFTSTIYMPLSSRLLPTLMKMISSIGVSLSQVESACIYMAVTCS